MFLAVVQAEAWMPPAISKFKQRIQKRRLRNNATKGSNTEDAVATEEKEDQEEDTETAERRRLSVLPWWEDSWSEAFMNSFPITSVVGTPSSEEIEQDELAHYEKPRVNASAQVLHFCFLSHGHRGFATDLSYLQRVMQHHAELEKQQRNATGSAQHDMIVHCAHCNEGKTTDGVENGGERLVQEILQVIRAELNQREQRSDTGIQDITISIVGNSLGGIYGRYAIARLAQKAADEENHPELSNATTSSATDEACVLLDGKYRLHFNIFCSTASPHLGISKHTYVPLPRSVELGAARVLGDTGRDLFRLNDLLKTMATCPTFLDPLRRFRKRIAYANAYKTDFPVPASTAAFLSEQSTYPHHFAPEDKEDDNIDHDDDGDSRRHIVATLHTPSANNPPRFEEAEDIVDDLVQMSASLDSLGWKKVFIDVRQEIPLRVALPRSKSIRRTLKRNLIVNPLRLRKSLSEMVLSTTSTRSSNTEETGGYDSDDSTSSRPSAMHRLRQKGVVESRDVASVVSTPDDMRLSFPLGHNLMVALSRDGISGGLYKGGRPVMDSLAKELVHDIFDWDLEAENDAAARETRKLSQGGN